MTLGSAAPVFTRQPTCWVCGGNDLRPVATLQFDLHEYGMQDPELAALSGSRLALNRCIACAFGQPEAIPTLDRYFDRMYDQRWAPDWIRTEFESEVKDFIFDRILKGLSRRLPGSRRTLLDVGAHAGRFIARARASGWQAEGLELNPQTAAFAARATGARIRQLNLADLDSSGERFDAVTLTDVLEHMPHPRRVLRQIAQLLAPGGWVAVKVPCGPAQVTKERWRGRLFRGYRPTLADNLVHVSHFSPHSLKLSLEEAGFGDVAIEAGAPELPEGRGIRARSARVVRLGLFHAASILPGGIHSPLCLNLQAYARVP